jgi:hypothetical protein
MRKTSKTYGATVQQILSLTVGYPALVIYASLALAETLSQSKVLWAIAFIALYLATLIAVRPRFLSRV